MATKKKTAAKKPAPKKAPSTIGKQIDEIIAKLKVAKAAAAAKPKPNVRAYKAALNAASVQLTKLKNTSTGGPGAGTGRNLQHDDTSQTGLASAPERCDPDIEKGHFADRK